MQVHGRCGFRFCGCRVHAVLDLKTYAGAVRVQVQVQVRVLLGAGLSLRKYVGAGWV